MILILHYYIIVFYILVLTIAPSRKLKVNGLLMKERDISKFILFITMGLLGFLSSFRNYTIGIDTAHYLNGYYYINELARYDFYEIGYVLFNILIYNVFDNFQFLIIFSSIIIYFGFSKYFLENSNNVILCSVLFFSLLYRGSLSIIRQYMACSFLLLGIIKLKKRNLPFFFIYVLLASLFHSSAFIMGIYIFLTRNIYYFNKKNNKRFIYYFFFIIMLIGIIYLVMQFVSIYSEKDNSLNMELKLGFVIQIVYYLFVLFLCKYMNRNNKNSNIENNIFLIDLYSIIVIYIISLSLDISSRFVIYFIPLVIVDVSNIFLPKYKKSFLYFLLILVSFSLFTIILILRPYWNQIYPYQFFWNYNV